MQPHLSATAANEMPNDGRKTETCFALKNKVLGLTKNNIHELLID